MPGYTPLAPAGANSLKTTPVNFGSLGSGISLSPSGSVNNSSYSPTSNSQTAGLLTSALLPSTLSSPVKATSTGGITFNPSAAAGYTTPVASTPTQPKSSLSEYLTSTQPTSGGGTISTQGSNVSGYTPSPSYSIDTNNIPSNALSSNTGMGDLAQSHSQYSDYVNALAQAQGYSPNYLNALQGTYAAQSQGAGLQFNSALLNSNLATGNNLPGDTEAYAQGATAKAQAQNTLAQAQNSIQQLGANQALNTQQLARTGAISAAQSQLQYNPVAVSSENAINQYNTLQQQYPAASIPAYNPALSPATNQQIAQELVSNSPAYRSQFQQQYATPGGGTGIYNKLDVGSGAFSQNQDGSYTLVPAAAAALGSANASVVQNQLSNLSNINSAVDASTKTLQTTTQFMNQYGLNQSGVSILSQIQNSTNKNLDKAGAVAGLNADLNALRADYAQYLVGRGGSVAGTNDEANKAIPDTISPAQLQTLVQQMQQDGQNAAEAVSGQINSALSGITNNSVPGSSTGSGGSGWASLGD